jgi:hypothetical protein
MHLLREMRSRNTSVTQLNLLYVLSTYDGLLHDYEEAPKLVVGVLFLLLGNALGDTLLAR